MPDNNNKLMKTVTDVIQSRQWLMKYSYGGNCSWIWMYLEEAMMFDLNSDAMDYVKFTVTFAASLAIKHYQK